MTPTTFPARRAALAILLATTTLAFASQALAQALPSYGIGAAVNTSEQTRRAAPQLHTTGTPVLPRLSEPQLMLKDKETLRIRRFALEGDRLIDEAEAQALLAPYLGRKLTIAQIYEAADKITALYRERGYMLAKAYVPAQDARKGTLRIKVLAGKYGERTINNESIVRESFLRGLIDAALGGSPYIHQNELERAMLLTADLNGAGMPRVVTATGKAEGTSDMAFNVPAERRVDGYLTGDNYGSPLTGRDRLSGGVNLNSPLGFGDKLSAFGILSNDGGLKNGRLAYAFPVGYSGLRAEIAAFRTTYVLGREFETLDSTGTADAVSASLTAPVKRQRDDSIYLSGSFTHKALNDMSLGVSTNQRNMDVGLVGVTRDTNTSLFGLALTTSTTLSTSFGNVAYPDPLELALNTAGADTAGRFAKVNLAFTGTIAFTDLLSLTTTVKAQKSLTGNLDSSEQMFLSGSYGVRSFDEGVAADNGYLVQPELKYALPGIASYRHSLGLFTDVGAVQIANPNYTSMNAVTPLNDIGVGYYATYEYSPDRTLLLKAHIARSYGGVNGVALTYDRGTKSLLQVGFTY